MIYAMKESVTGEIPELLADEKKPDPDIIEYTKSRILQNQYGVVYNLQCFE
jgi:hypothetical protein